MARNYWDIRGHKDQGKMSLIARYLWAARRARGFIFDIGCGYGYGTQLLAVNGTKVRAVDPDVEAITAAKRWNAFRDVIRYDCTAVTKSADIPAGVDTIVALEVIEHLDDVAGFLRLCLAAGPEKMIASTPILPVADRPDDKTFFETPEAMDGVFDATGWQLVGSQGIDEIHQGNVRPMYRVAAYRPHHPPLHGGSGI